MASTQLGRFDHGIAWSVRGGNRSGHGFPCIVLTGQHAGKCDGHKRSVGTNGYEVGVGVWIASRFIWILGLGWLRRRVMVMVRMAVAVVMVVVILTNFVRVHDFNGRMGTRNVNKRDDDDQQMMEDASHVALFR